MQAWQQFASGYRNIEIAFGSLACCWRALWFVAGALIGCGFLALIPVAFLVGVLLLALLIVRCLGCSDVELKIREPEEVEIGHQADVRMPYDPPSRVLGPHHDGVDL